MAGVGSSALRETERRPADKQLAPVFSPLERLSGQGQQEILTGAVSCDYKYDAFEDIAPRS
jgi:diphthamide synthase (EF-2-diphthine--ammonia ligase)